MNIKRKMLIALLVSAGLYSFGNAKLFVEKLANNDTSKLFKVLSSSTIEKAEGTTVATHIKTS